MKVNDSSFVYTLKHLYIQGNLLPLSDITVGNLWLHLRLQQGKKRQLMFLNPQEAEPQKQHGPKGEMLLHYSVTSTVTDADKGA